MENNSRLIDRVAASDHGVRAAYPGLKKRERGEIVRPGGQDFKPAVGLLFRIPVVFIFCKYPFVQLTSAAAMYSRAKPVDTKIFGYIIPVSIEFRYNDHLAKTLQHQGHKKNDHHCSLTCTE